MQPIHRRIYSIPSGDYVFFHGKFGDEYVFFGTAEQGRLTAAEDELSELTDTGRDWKGVLEDGTVEAMGTRAVKFDRVQDGLLYAYLLPDGPPGAIPVGSFDHWNDLANGRTTGREVAEFDDGYFTGVMANWAGSVTVILQTEKDIISLAHLYAEDVATALSRLQ